jgi:hypothetical protein
MKIQLLAMIIFGLLQGAPSADRTLTCAPIDGVERVLGAPGVFIGDLHGSVESPAFLAALACHAANSGRFVVVAMEYDAKDQAVLDEFLLTTDEAKAVGVLTATTHWTQNRDGRASPAMRDALLEIHRLARGHPVKLIAYDHWGETSSEREKKSAELLRGIRDKQDAAAYWIVFGGNVHARKTKGLPFANAPAGSDDHEPLGFLIRDWALVHLDADYRGGATWACTGPAPDDCRAIELGPGCTVACPVHPIIRLQATNPAYDGVYDVGRLSVSGPLRRQLRN